MAKFMVCKICECDNFVSDYYVTIRQNEIERVFGSSSVVKSSSVCHDIIMCMWKSIDAYLSDTIQGLLIVGKVVSDNDHTTQIKSKSSPELSASNNAHVGYSVIQMSCSPNVCKQFGISTGQEVLVRTFRTAYYVHRVIFGARTADAFSFASNGDFSTVLLEGMSSESVLIQQNKCINAKSHISSCFQCMVVLSCDPFMQANLSSTSEIIVKNLATANVHCGLADYVHGGHRSEIFLTKKPLLLSDFAEELHFSPISNHLQMCNAANQFVRVDVDLDFQSINILLNQLNSNCEKVDELSTVVFTKYDASKLGLFNGCLLEVKSDGGNCNKSSRKQCSSDSLSVQLSSCSKADKICGKIVVASVSDILSNNDDDVKAYMLPCVWFNICNMSGFSLFDYRSKFVSLKVSIYNF